MIDNMQETYSKTPFLSYSISEFSETKGFTFQERNTGVSSYFVAQKNSNNDAHIAINILLQALDAMDKEVQILKDCMENEDFGDRKTLITEFKRIEKSNGFLSYSIKTGGENFTFSFEHNKSENIELIFKLESTIFYRKQDREEIFETYDKEFNDFLGNKYRKKNDMIMFGVLIIVTIVVPLLYYFDGKL